MDNYDEIVHAAYDDDESTPDERRPVLASVPLRGELEETEDEGRPDGLVLSLVGDQVAYARSVEGVWEYRYQWCVAVPAVAVLALGIRIVSHHHSFFGLLAALSAVMILAATLGLL